MANRPQWVEDFLKNPPPASDAKFSPGTLKRLSEPLKQPKKQ